MFLWDGPFVKGQFYPHAHVNTRLERTETNCILNGGDLNARKATKQNLNGAAYE